MTFKILLDIAQNLPRDSAYFQQARVQRTWNPDELHLGDRCSIVLNDLSLGWHLAERYARSGQNMPLAIQKYLPFRAFVFLTTRNSKDLVMARVHTFWKRKGQRLFLKALLTARDLSIRRIARLCESTLEEVGLFEKLCWNVRVRWNDLAFMTDLLRLDELDPSSNWNEESGLKSGSGHELRFLRAAFRYGSAGVFKAFGIPRGNTPPSAQQLRRDLLQEAGREAIAGALQGHFSSENNEALELLQTLHSMEQDQLSGGKHSDPSMRLEALSFSEAGMATFKKTVTEAARERMRLAQEYDSQQAALKASEKVTAEPPMQSDSNKE